MGDKPNARLDRAKQYLVIAESADSKREAYKMAAEEIAAAIDEGTTQRAVATALGWSVSKRGDSIKLRNLMKWRDSGYEAQTPWLADTGATDRAALSHGRKVLRERPDALAADVAAAMDQPEFRHKVVEAMNSDTLDVLDSEALHVNAQRSRAQRDEHYSGDPRIKDLLPEDENLDDVRKSLTANWADDYIIGMWSRANKLASLVAREGLVLGSLSDEEALEDLNDVMRIVGEQRAALQERVNDRKAAI